MLHIGEGLDGDEPVRHADGVADDVLAPGVHQGGVETDSLGGADDGIAHMAAADHHQLQGLIAADFDERSHPAAALEACLGKLRVEIVDLHDVFAGLQGFPGVMDGCLFPHAAAYSAADSAVGVDHHLAVGTGQILGIDDGHHRKITTSLEAFGLFQ